MLAKNLLASAAVTWLVYTALEVKDTMEAPDSCCHPFQRKGLDTGQKHTGGLTLNVASLSGSTKTYRILAVGGSGGSRGRRRRTGDRMICFLAEGDPSLH
jgi:hypothetical protein